MNFSDALAASAADTAARYDEICQLLVAAGYFRARIGSLTPFDKVVGGMVWCMTATSVDVDVLFEENATIGQKIKIGEGIERALRQMKCRIPLQAHQIQGLDYAAIFPVVQWLVKRAYEFREEIADAMRRLSTSQCDEHFTLRADADVAMRRAASLPTARQMVSRYAPVRSYRPKSGPSGMAAAVHARRVLMEFGAAVSALRLGSEGEGEPGAASSELDAPSTADADGRSDAQLRRAQTDMAEVDGEGELSQNRIVRGGARWPTRPWRLAHASRPPPAPRRRSPPCAHARLPLRPHHAPHRHDV